MVSWLIERVHVRCVRERLLHVSIILVVQTDPASFLSMFLTYFALCPRDVFPWLSVSPHFRPHLLAEPVAFCIATKQRVVALVRQPTSWHGGGIAMDEIIHLFGLHSVTTFLYGVPPCLPIKGLGRLKSCD